ncbi:PREDICTED: cyclin-D4-1-like isoform X2 [Lupinus angustifolius]|uniref:cyclin-D4-1-like isoform X2 n=1 Tax=Lupinus angustifolius TaxID=3871 RepID=UPI00092F5727|nr:PREDICTED: cyclin-D4-1-like isoform X2 [Lupinus angustifolius]
MAPSFDCLSSLLCFEDNSIFDENDYVGSVETLEEDTMWYPSYRRNLNQTEHFAVEPNEFLLLPLQSDESLNLMVEKECYHLPREDYLNRVKNGDLDFGDRKEAIDWIQKKDRAWTMQLLAVACLSLAAKIDETKVPMPLDLQVGESDFVFEAKIIQRMELMVLNTLKWRMQSITPFSFIDYFLSKVNDDQSQIRSSILRSIQLILSTIRGIDFLEFKPSEIAAAVAISVVGETKTVHTEKAISVLIPLVEKERVLKCVKMLQELSSNNVYADHTSGSSVPVPVPVHVPCLPQSPIGVLDAICFSYKSDDTNKSDDSKGGSCASSPHDSPSAKRRKLK